VVVLAAAVAAAGCKRHDSDGFDRPGDPEPIWSATSTTLIEGAQVVIVLSLDKPFDDGPYDVDITISDPTRVSCPTTVTFPTGVTTRNVTIASIADADNTDQTVTLTAEAGDDTSLLNVVLRETDVALGAAHGPVSYGPNTALLAGAGADDLWSTADDVLRVAANIGIDDPVFTDVVIGAVTPGPHALPVPTGVSDGAVVLTNGPDLTLGTADDTLVEVGSLSGTPVVADSIVVGRMESSERCRPVMVGTSVVIAHRGADLVTSGDDALAIVTGLGTGTLAASSFGVPTGIAFDIPSRIVSLDATSLAIFTTGPDFLLATSNEQLFYVTGIGGAPVASPSTTGFLRADPSSQPVRIGADDVAFMVTGADFVMGAGGDDAIVSFVDMATVFASMGAAVGSTSADPAGALAPTGTDSVLISRVGADLIHGTADDDIVLASALTAGAPVLTPLAGTSPFSGAAGLITVLSTSAAVRASKGADLTAGTADDGLIVLTSLTAVAASATFATGALADAAPLASTATSAAFLGEGTDLSPNTPDDLTLELTAIGTSPALQSNQTGALSPSGPPALVPLAAGGHALLIRTTGADSAPSTDDDLLETLPVP
jgi:hypothetical protein